MKHGRGFDKNLQMGSQSQPHHVDTDTPAGERTSPSGTNVSIRWMWRLDRWSATALVKSMSLVIERLIRHVIHDGVGSRACSEKFLRERF
tara:strand:- start:314 stop:583 length:270 start_codon:yes stop_codon:yes gene_type:complete